MARLSHARVVGASRAFNLSQVDAREYVARLEEELEGRGVDLATLRAAGTTRLLPGG